MNWNVNVEIQHLINVHGMRKILEALIDELDAKIPHELQLMNDLIKALQTYENRYGEKDKK